MLSNSFLWVLHIGCHNFCLYHVKNDNKMWRSTPLGLLGGEPSLPEWGHPSSCEDQLLM